MKRTILMITLLALVSTANAGWCGKDKVKELKPAAGYTEKTETVTNVWSEAVALATREPEIVEEANELGYITVYGTISCTNSYYTSIRLGGTRIDEDGIHFPKAEPCREKHVSDYPKQATLEYGVQKKVTTVYYKEGKPVARVVHYLKPHTKITKLITTALEPKTSIETTIEKQ